MAKDNSWKLKVVLACLFVLLGVSLGTPNQNGTIEVAEVASICNAHITYDLRMLGVVGIGEW